MVPGIAELFPRGPVADGELPNGLVETPAAAALAPAVAAPPQPASPVDNQLAAELPGPPLLLQAAGVHAGAAAVVVPLFPAAHPAGLLRPLTSGNTLPLVSGNTLPPLSFGAGAEPKTEVSGAVASRPGESRKQRAYDCRIIRAITKKGEFQ